ncbi:MAG TPA: response regulator transcription factor [Caulobacteraceae bacterium]|nr:response regulator transcription factor [Caulobacteraceae bacterium]
MRVLIVDDHAIVREGMAKLLAVHGDHQFREAVNGREALELLAEFRPDLIILDLDLPALGGIELLRQLIDEGAKRVLVLTMHVEPLYVRRALDAGAQGYVTKNASPDEILVAIQRLASGGRYVEAEVAQSLVLEDGTAKSTLDNLSPRELEILRQLSRGASLTDIAVALGVSYKTVANNCSFIKSKLGVGRTTDLVRLALDAGLT